MRKVEVGVWEGSVVLCGAVLCGAVRCGAVRCGAVQCGAVRCGVVWCGVQLKPETVGLKRLPQSSANHFIYGVGCGGGAPSTLSL